MMISLEETVMHLPWESPLLFDTDKNFIDFSHAFGNFRMPLFFVDRKSQVDYRQKIKSKRVFWM